jgi:hypothetical protein
VLRSCCDIVMIWGEYLLVISIRADRLLRATLRAGKPSCCRAFFVPVQCGEPQHAVTEPIAGRRPLTIPQGSQVVGEGIKGEDGYFVELARERFVGVVAD